MLHLELVSVSKPDFSDRLEITFTILRTIQKVAVLTNGKITSRAECKRL